MMVTGLQLPFQSSPLDGMSAKSQSMDSETIQPLSFGEILKAKEKQLQQEQEVSASSLAAALVTLQTLSIAMQSVPHLEISNNTAKVDTQSGVQTNAATLMSSQINTSTSLDGFSQLAANTAGTLDRPVIAQTATERSIPNEPPASISDPSQNIPAESPETASTQFISVETHQLATANLSKAETTTSPIDNDIKSQAVTTVMKPAKAEVTPATLKQVASETLTDQIAAQLESPVSTPKTVEQQVSTPGSIGDTPNSIIAADAKNEIENVAERSKFKVPVNVNSGAQSLPPQAEAKDVRLQSDTIAQPVNVSNFSANEAAIPETNVDGTIDKSALPFTPHVEVPDTTRGQSLSGQGETDQKTIAFGSQQIEKSVNTPAPATELSYEAPIQDLSTQPEAEQPKIPLTSKQTEKLENTSIAKIEITNTSSVQPSAVHAEVDQKVIPFSSQQIDGSVNTAKIKTTDATLPQESFGRSSIAQKANSSIPQLGSEPVDKPTNVALPTGNVTNEAPVHYSDTQSTTHPTMTRSASPQVEQLTNAPIPTVQTPDATLVRNTDAPFVTTRTTFSINSEQAEQLVSMTTSPTEGSNSTSVQASAVPTKINQKTISFAVSQSEDSVNGPVATIQTPHITAVQYSPAAVIADQETLSFIPQPEVASSIVVMPAIEEPTPDFEIPVPALTPSFGKTEIEIEADAKQTVIPTESPTSQARPANDPSPARSEIAAHDDVLEVETVEIKSDKPTKTNSLSQQITGVNRNTETGDAEFTTPLQRDEVNNSTDNQVISREFEKTVPQVSYHAKTSAATSAQSEIELPALQAETNDENPMVETKVPEEKTNTIAQPTAVKQFIDKDIRNPEADQAMRSGQISQNAQPISISDASPYREIDEVAQRPVSKTEVTDELGPRDFSEIPLAEAITPPEDTIPELKQVEKPANAVALPAAEEAKADSNSVETTHASGNETTSFRTGFDHNTQKTVAPAVVYAETVDMNLVQPALGEDPDLYAVEQETTDQPAGEVALDTEIGFPARTTEVETKSVTPNNTSAPNETRQVVSQTGIHTEVVESLQNQGLEQSLPTKEIKNSEDVTQDIKRIDQLKGQSDIPTNKASIAEENIVDKTLVSQETVTSSVANTAGVEGLVEHFVNPRSSQSELTNTDPVKPVYDIPSDSVGETKTVVTQTSPADSSTYVVQPATAFAEVAKDLPATEKANHFQNTSPSQQALVPDTNSSEDIRLQPDKPLQSQPSLPHSDTMSFNVWAGNDLKITGLQSTVSHIEETSRIVNQPTINTLEALTNVNYEELTLESKTVKLPIGTTTSSTEISQTPIEFSTETKDILPANASANSIERKTETTFNVGQVATNSDRSVIDTMKAEISVEQQPIIESKITKPQAETLAGTSQSAVETSAVVKDLPTTPTENKTSEVETQTADYSGKKVAPGAGSRSNSIRAEAGVEQKKAVFEAKAFAAQEDSDIRLSEGQQSTVGIMFTTEADTDSETEAVIHRAVSQPDLNQAAPLQSVDGLQQTQATVDQKEIVFEAKPVEPDVNTFASVEILQSNTDVPDETIVIPELHTDNAETGDQATQPAPHVNGLESLISNSQPLKSTSETVETKNVQKPVNVDAPEIVFSQSTTKPSEKVEAANEIYIEKSDVDVLSVGPNEKINNGQTLSTNESKVITNTVSLPLSPLNSNENSVPSQPATSIKIEAGKQILKSKPANSKAEESLPTEKQPKLNQMPETAAASTGPIKEATIVESNGKMPINQVNAQAAEVAQQIIHEMNVKIKSGPTSMHLQLNPKELGAIDIEMVSTSQGVSVTFFAEQSNTGKLLETQLNQLRESLIDSGVQLSGLNISQHGLSEQKGGFNHETNFTQFPQGDVSQSEANMKATPQTGRITRQLGEVDYLI